MVSDPMLFRFLQDGQLAELDERLKSENVNIPNAGGYSLLHKAVSLTNIDAVQLLLRKGSQVNAPDPAGDTPLHYAVGRMNYEIAKILLEAGANPNQQGRRKCTPLRWAISRPLEDFRLIHLLIAHGADPWIKNDSGSSTISYAETVYPDLAEELKRGEPKE